MNPPPPPILSFLGAIQLIPTHINYTPRPVYLHQLYV